MRILENFPDIQSSPVEIRISRAQAPDTPPEILRQLARDPFWFVRDRVAANPHAPTVCLQELMLDPDFRVRGEAERTLLWQLGRELKPSLQTRIEKASQSQIHHHANPQGKEHRR